jgi:type I restriction enzyme R subunit
MDKQGLSESDICSKFITPAVIKAGRDEMLQLRREVSFTKGRIIVRSRLGAACPLQRLQTAK